MRRTRLLATFALFLGATVALAQDSSTTTVPKESFGLFTLTVEVDGYVVQIERPITRRHSNWMIEFAEALRDSILAAKLAADVAKRQDLDKDRLLQAAINATAVRIGITPRMIKVKRICFDRDGQPTETCDADH